MRKSLVRTLTVTMTAVMCAGTVLDHRVGSESRKADTQAKASEIGDNKTAGRSYELMISGIGDSLNHLPIYTAEQEDWFEEKGLDIKEVLLINGPVQVEPLSSDSWGIGCTSVGDVLTSVLGYDTLVLGSNNMDDGTQYAFTRNDSDTIKAGKGHNSLSDEIYGDADSWKGESILCDTGSVTQYMPIKILEGFRLTVDDVNFIVMDPAAVYGAFLAGKGDVYVLAGVGGTFKMPTESDKYIPVTSGPMADSDLICSFVANKNSYANPDKYETMKVLMEVYFRTIDWMKGNREKVINYYVDVNDENGSSMGRETIAKCLRADIYYTLQEACGMLSDRAEGSDRSVMDQRFLDVLDSFISVGNYKEGDQKGLVGHTDGRLLNEAPIETAN